MSDLLVSIAFMAVVVGGGLSVGFAARPDAWYAGLAKAPFNPPNWIFAPVWILLYIMIAFAGMRTFERGLDTALGLWVAQLILNFAWSPVFFRLHRPALALTIVAALFAVIVAFIVQCWSTDNIAALLFVPYACWVAFAMVLNAWIVSLN